MDYFAQFAASTSAFFIAKDVYSNYLCASSSMALLVGWKSAKNAINKTDYDLPCDAAKYADSFIKLDKLVVSGKRKNLVTIDIQPYACGWKALIVQRDPLFNKDKKITGLITSGIDIVDLNILNTHILLNERFLGKKRQATYILNSDELNLPLTDQQKACLFLLCRNRKITEIAYFLRKTRDEIDAMIMEIKLALKCETNQQLVEKAYAIGFHYYIPSNNILNSFDLLFGLKQNSSFPGLSLKEIDCIKLLSEGKTAKQIAILYHLSPRTVEAYLNNARNKLNCHNSAQLVAQAIRIGIIN